MKASSRTLISAVLLRAGCGAMAGFLFGLAFFAFLLHQYGYALRVEGTRASGEVSASCAISQPLPDGNHGENVSTGSGS